MLIGTAGHIDHGKTALVKALTGIDADRLPEEKARGITLDLGYAHSPDGILSFVDVPGHERLIHNMLSGATGIDFMLLVVAADDGPMPQTREHLRILDLLGVTLGAVAISKIDLVDAARLVEVETGIRALLADTAMRDVPCLSVSARTGAGVPELAKYLATRAAQAAPRPSEGGFRLAIDRCFGIAGAGTVVTGTVHAGAVSVDDHLMLSPAGIEVRVRSVQTHNRAVARVVAGERCALNLTGEGFARAAVSRGQWLVAPRLHHPTQRIDARIRLTRPARHWMPIHLHLGSARVDARLALLEGDHAGDGQDMLTQLVLEQPIGALHGDRFILRDPSQSDTLGGGVVLDPFASARGRRASSRLARLRLLEGGPLPQVLTNLLAATPLGISLSEFALRHNVPLSRLDALCAGLPNCTRTGTGEAAYLFATEAWNALRAQVLSNLALGHEREPDMMGVSRERLRRMAAGGLAPSAFDALLHQLRTEGVIAYSGVWLHLPGHQATLLPREELLWQRIHPLLSSSPWQPPRVRDIGRSLGVPEQSVRATLKQAARAGLVYPVAHDHYFAASAVKALAGTAATLAMRHAHIGAARFRDAIGTGRKLAIQILEFFDRTGYTRRVKDTHMIRNAHLFDDVAG